MAVRGDYGRFIHNIVPPRSNCRLSSITNSMVNCSAKGCICCVMITNLVLNGDHGCASFKVDREWLEFIVTFDVTVMAIYH